MIRRRLEQDVMDDPARARAYADADFADVNEDFVTAVTTTFPVEARGRILDIGCGPADIAIRLARAVPAATIVGADASRTMLSIAAEMIEQASLADRIQLFEGKLPESVPDGDFDLVISNSFLHHLADPMDFWKVVKGVGRRPIALLCQDLVRPNSHTAAELTVERYAGSGDALLKEDFFNSLLASFTINEISGQVREAHLDGLHVAQVSDRHWRAKGLVK